MTDEIGADDSAIRDADFDFISNHKGSYPTDILLATLPAPLTIALTSFLLPYVIPGRYLRYKYSSRIFIHVLMEIFTVCLPLLLSFTLLSKNNLLFVLYLATFAFCSSKSASHSSVHGELMSRPLLEKKPSWFTNYRAGMNLATALCILAVDFNIFPRRYAKTETYGYSLMDVGVGSFVFSHGLLDRAGEGRTTLAWKKVIPLVVLGFIRLISVKASGYHEHVTEYGVHWNFFFTLAVVNFASQATLLRRIAPWQLSTSILIGYHLLLKLGLESWIMGPSERSGLLVANREGVFSLFGYIAIYFAASQLGGEVLKPRNCFKDRLNLSYFLMLVSVVSWAAVEFSPKIFGDPSRRLANVSYCVWMVAYNATIMAAYSLVDLWLLSSETSMLKDCDAGKGDAKLLPAFREPYLMRLINFNGLPFFLLANLLTGLVNLSLKTTQVSDASSLLILLVYCSVLSCSAAVAYLWRIQV